ncbi:ubiquitin carboxyl-terminal hydrolase BAP1-like [Saccoglossus kowalevskii]|uniref:ubiquitinyl hydrolase 1 n=1 Tax=Saccoglossus kowalevskii TaxID=10224 RepID=A0ABM0MLQ7_SACKO|nr:PREDICTED: ubiquitin carboxyl-terminal hydrolase BAP1-like [Saccoglossus kowalevskii]
MHCERFIFAQQLIPNSCATHALLSVLLNCSSLNLGATLTEFKEFTKNFNPENKGYAIGSMPQLAKAHNSHAKPEPRQIPEKQTGVSTVRTMEAFHFVSYVPIKGRLFELDGLKPYPIDHGPWGEQEEWTDKFRRVIRERLDMGGCDIRFNLMAVVPDRRQVYDQKLQLLKNNRMVLYEALQHLVKYTQPSLPVSRTTVTRRDPIITRSKPSPKVITKPPPPVTKKEPKNNGSKSGNNKNSSSKSNSSTYRLPAALDTHNYAKSPLSEHEDSSGGSSSYEEADEDEEDEEEEDSETETDEEVAECQQSSENEIIPEPPQPKPLSNTEIERHLHRSEVASNTYIRISLDPSTTEILASESVNLDPTVENFENILMKAQLNPEVKLIPTTGALSDDINQPLTIQTMFHNRAVSPAPSESTDTASEMGSAFNSPLRSNASSRQNSPSHKIARFREWKQSLISKLELVDQENKGSTENTNTDLTEESTESPSTAESPEREFLPIPEDDEQSESQDKTEMPITEETIAPPQEQSGSSSNLKRLSDSHENEPEVKRSVTFADNVGGSDSEPYEYASPCEESKDSSDMSSEEEQNQVDKLASPCTLHPKVAVAVLKSLDAEIMVCEQRLGDETEKRKKYRIDDCRRSHNYDPFITTFLSILAEQGQLAGLVEQHMLIRRRQGYSLGRLHKTRKPDRRKRSRPSQKKKGKK